VAFNQAIYEVGKDRSHGLKSAQITQQADDTYQQVDDIDSAIKELQVRALHGKGNRPLARPAGMTTLERRRDQLERHAQALEQKATETKTTGSLTWVQLAGFLMAAIGGALFELGTMVRLRGRIVRLRDRADEAYGTLFLTAQALWAVPRRKGGAGPDVLAKARDHLDGIAPKPEWEALDALVAQARSGVADERDDSLLKAVR
jgi:hypothetical protein